ncbi:MAG: hypothetical protein GY816_08850, partial [Cytophagales bacterium]|nr:hypothetical protein [Cytophagales bacterium]
FNNQRQNWNNNAGNNQNPNWRNNTGQNQWGNAPNQGGYQGNRWQDNNQWRNWYEQPYQGNQRYQPQNQPMGNWNNNAGNPNYRPPMQQNQGPTGNNNVPPPGVRAIGTPEEQPKPQEIERSEGLVPDTTASTSSRTEIGTESSANQGTESGDVWLNGYPKPESCGVNPKVVQMLDQRNQRGMTRGITNGRSDQMEVTVDQRFAQLDNNLNAYQKEQEDQVRKMADETTHKMETVIECTLQQQTKITSELKGEVEGMRVHVNKIIDDKERKEQRKEKERREKEMNDLVEAKVEERCQEREKKRREMSASTSLETSVAPSLNVYSVSPYARETVFEPWIPGEKLPLQSFEVPTINLIVEGKRIKCTADTRAGPSLVVSEQLGREILGRKYRTQAEVNNAILPSEIRHVSNCAGGNVEIIGQAKVRVKFLKLTFNTPMLILAAASKRMEGATQRKGTLRKRDE